MSKSIKSLIIGLLASATVLLPVGVAGASTHKKHYIAVPAKVWCGLSIGESKANVLAQMGRPHGKHAATWESTAKAFHLTFSEWDVGGDILLASYSGNKVVDLQAYAGAIGPVGAKNLSCAPFRNGGVAT